MMVVEGGEKWSRRMGEWRRQHGLLLPCIEVMDGGGGGGGLEGHDSKRMHGSSSSSSSSSSGGGGGDEDRLLVDLMRMLMSLSNEIARIVVSFV